MNVSMDCFNDSRSAIIRHNGYMGLYNNFTTKYILEAIFVPFWFVIGFPGNLINIYIWSRRSMNHMVSSLYLAVLAVVDCLFFVRHLIWYLQSTYEVNTIKNRIMCQLFPYTSMTIQYLPPLLIMGFTVERFISVCYPLYRRKLCTVERTRHVIIGILIFCIVIALPQLYFFHYVDESSGDCEDLGDFLTKEYKNSSKIYRDYRYLFFYIFNILSESFFFIVIPFMILFLNIIVITKLNQVHRFRRILTRNQSKKRHESQVSTTLSLLTVSFFLIFTSLPASIFQMIKFNKNETICLSDDEIRQDPNWTAHFRLVNIQTQVDMLSITHYAANFYIYMFTCRTFRAQFCNIFFRNESDNRCNHLSLQSNMSRLTIRGR